MPHLNRGLRRAFSAAVAAVCLIGAAGPSAQADKPGILLMAHGGRASWNDHVSELVSTLDAKMSTEVAFGMASRQTIQAAVDRLVARQVTRIIAVPLFISSHSSVITSTQYLLGARADAPADLAVFARMSHGSNGGHGHGAHGAGHGAVATNGSDAADGTKPVTVPVPVTMTAALDSHAIVGDILVDRARSLSRDPAGEAVVLVAHGPVAEDDNRKWLEEMAVLAGRVRASAPYASVDSLTVRDDAPGPIREAATAELRTLVQRRRGDGRRVLVVPLLLSFGGIEQGIRKRLEGLDYVMSEQGLMPDARIADWVLESVAAAR